MSDVIKLNIKSRNIKAVISDHAEVLNGFVELPEVLEREKQESAHKIELENEYNKGYEVGKNEITSILEQKHSDELLSQSQDFYKILASFEEKFIVFENNYHHLVLKVSQKIAEKILQKELKNYLLVEKILDQNLRKIIGTNDIVIKLNPKDNELIQKSSKEYLTSLGITKIRFEPNKNVQIGGCLVESEIGNLDARIETQITEIIKVLENSITGVELE